jgi:hypothetical protein
VTEAVELLKASDFSDFIPRYIEILQRCPRQSVDIHATERHSPLRPADIQAFNAIVRHTELDQSVQVGDAR